MFLFKNNKQSTFDGFRAALFLLTMIPAELNNRSDGTEVAGIQSNFFESLAKVGKRRSFSLHHCSGSADF